MTRRRLAPWTLLTVASLVVTLSPAGAAAAGPVPPPPLSRERAPSLGDSTYGSGHFGRWTVDEYGLPAYDYRVDHRTDRRARQPELLGGSSRALHQLGNDHIQATASNDGDVMLWSQARLVQWANYHEPQHRHYAGGYGYLNTDGKIFSTAWPAAAGATLQRRFGLGYYGKHLRAEGLEIADTAYAPFGDDPVLLHDVTIRNTTDRARRVSWFEYWDVNPYDRTAGRHRGLDAPSWDAGSGTLTVRQAPDGGDTRPMTIFASALQGPHAGFETSVAGFFGAGDQARPAAVRADRLAGRIAPGVPSGTPGQTLFAFRAPVSLPPGGSVTLRYAYGMAHADQVDGLVRRFRAAPDPLRASQDGWARWVPKADFGPDFRWTARELAWAAYLLRSASAYEEECGHHTVTQGGYYQYGAGQNLGYRNWLHYLLPLTYTEPALAREVLRYAVKRDREHAEQPAYGTGPLCSDVEQGTSNDLYFWLLLAAGEYGLGTRDVAFFDERLPFLDTGREATVWEHLKLAYQRQEALRGPHGGYRMGSNGDWSDFLTLLGPMTESTLVAAQLAYAYPKLAELAELRGDNEFAARLRARGVQLRETVAAEWTGRGWFSRGYFEDRQIGRGMPFLEPQPWALLSGATTPERSRTLVANIRRFLTGHGAPGGPSRIGSAQVPARNDPDITERGPVYDPDGGPLADLVDLVMGLIRDTPTDGAAAYPGGVWYDPNGWLTWALGELDGVVPGARELAWDEYTRNTLAAHATAFPDHWNGTISTDDVCQAWYAKNPARCGIGLLPVWAGQITEQPTWMVMNAIRLAGLTPTHDGYRVDPHLPMDTFTVRLPSAGIAAGPGRIRGYVRPERGGELTMDVVLPERMDPAHVVAFAAGERVPHQVDGDTVRFRLTAGAGQTADWAVTAT